MKKKALALGLSMTILAQSIWVPASFAADTSNESSTTDNLTAQSESYSHTISDEGLELIKSFEGYSPYPQWDVSQYSFGYGSFTEVVRDENGDPVKDKNGHYIAIDYPDGISEREATELLRDMVEDFNVHLNLFLETYKIKLNQNQFDALSSFTYNLGKYVWSTKNYIFIQMLKSGEYLTDQERFIESYTSICNAGGSPVEGLRERRKREVAIFYSEDSISDPNADLYVVNATTLYIRSEPTTASSILGSLKSSQVIRVHRYSDDGEWAYTSYCGYYGWVCKQYLIGINESALITQVDENGKDGQGVHYTFDNATMTAKVGSNASSSNTSQYSGEYAGEVFLTKHLLYNGSVYTLTAISDSAFTGCDKLNKIYIPPCVTTIGDNAFKGSSLNELLYTAGSYAADWAKQSGFNATDYRCRTGHLNADWRVVQRATDSQTQIEERSCSICGETQTRSFDRIEIVSFPKKIEYKEAQPIETDGLALEVVYTDGTRIPAPDFKIADGDTTKLGEQSVTVQYSVFTTEFKIVVNEKTLTGIKISKKPSKLTYIEGGELVLDGLAVKAVYDNGTTATVAEYSVSGYDPNKVGKQTVTVTYNGFSATFEVTVKAKSLTAFTFASYPDQLEYFCGESFNSAGMVLKISYNNGTVELTDKGFKISGYNANRAGTQKIKVTYGGITQSIQVVVILNYLKSDQYTPKKGNIVITQEQLTVAKLTKSFDASDRVVVVKDGKQMPDDSIVGTGMTVQLRYNSEVQDRATLIVAGDLTGDGRCSLSDFVALSDYFVERTELSDAALAAADINRDGSVDLTDYVELYEVANRETQAVALSKQN